MRDPSGKVLAGWVLRRRMISGSSSGGKPPDHEGAPMFRGFATISFYADDLAAARDWYTKLLGIEAYYAFPEPPAAPAYIEFRVGDDGDELGFIDRRYAPSGASNAPG